MSEVSSLFDALTPEALWRLDQACCRFERAWLDGRAPRLEDHLAGLGDAERPAFLRELLRLEVHYRRQAGESVSACEYRTRFPDATEVVGAILPAAGPQPETVDGSRPAGPPETPGTVDDAPVDAGPADAADRPPAGRFRVRRFHAAGNLGEVYVAEDTELYREVALKEIKSAQAHRPDSRRRFLLEGEVTGRLEHPGVVPVYGLGAYADGRPYYAMRFIKGETLAAAVRRFHGGSAVSYDGLEFRQLLGRFVAVCQAVAYAHSRGVIHRDLKPANIMLGPYGETLVVDWGLAKLTDRPAEENGAEGSVLRPVQGGLAETLDGVLMGTPAYMSPEQARGEVSVLGPAADVYGLGATLYELLTNRPPLQGPLHEVVQRANRGEWLPARQVSRAIPPALEAVCAKAMALRPEDRYASALELAKDVEAWLGDEPVSAYREPRRARARRWMRKHPRKVTAVAVLLVTSVVGLTAGTVLLERSKREEQASREMAQRQADYLLEEVGGDLLLNEPRTQALRRHILLHVMEGYEQFLEKRSGDVHTRVQMAKAKRQLGELYGQVDRIDEARTLLQRAVGDYEQLLLETPADRELRFGLAQAHLALAGVQLQSAEPGEGKHEADRAIDLLVLGFPTSLN